MVTVEIIFHEEHNDGCNHQSQSLFSMSKSLYWREKKVVNSLASVTQWGHRRWDLPPLSNSMTKYSFNFSETQGLFFIVTVKAYTDVNLFGLIPSSH